MLGYFDKMAAEREADEKAAGRDAGGRFAQGNKAGRGNPHHRKVARLRAALLERVTPDDIAAVVAALVAKAKGGDVAAIKLLLDRVFGRVTDLDTATAGEQAETGCVAIRPPPEVVRELDEMGALGTRR